MLEYKTRTEIIGQSSVTDFYPLNKSILPQSGKLSGARGKEPLRGQAY